jgi:NitT/TauT family transport system permease protein/putative hydroxymethylpyrimidine transport system permease protein
VTALLLVVALLGAWQLFVALSHYDAIVLPAPSDVGSSLWEDRGLLWSNLGPTATEIVLGLAIAMVVALAVAVLIHMLPRARRAVLPLLAATQAVPVAVMAPVLVAVFGFDLRPKVTIVAIVTFFPIVVTTLDGLASVDPALRKLLRTFGASRWRALRHVDAPAALPGMLSGTKIAIAVAVIGAVLSEAAGGTDGLGLVITQATNQLDTARAFAATVVLAALAGLLFGALTLAERRLVPWAARARNRGGSPT